MTISTFPLPGVRVPPWSNSRSGRLRQRVARSRRAACLANDAISSLNYLHNDSFTKQRSSLFPSPLQQRMLDHVRDCSVRFVSCQSDQSYTDRLCGDPPSVLHEACPSGDKLASLIPPLSYTRAPQPATHLVADRVALPSDLQRVDLLERLPPDLSDFYSNPDNILLPRHLRRSAPRAVLVRSQSDYLQVILRMYRQGMVTFMRKPEVVNGIFCVDKKDGMLRLIIDARPANAAMRKSTKVNLPSPSLLADLQAPTGSVIYTAKADIDNFYHRLRLPSWLVPFFGLPSVRAGDLGLQGFHPDEMVHPRCLTLPMGWSHSTFLAQAVHLHLLDTEVPALSSRDRITNDSDSRMDRPRHSVYLDDLGLYSADDPERLREALTQYLAACRRVGLAPKESKTVWPTAEGVSCLGLHIDGRRATVGVHPVRLRLLVNITRKLLHLGSCSGRVLERLLGHWTWAMLVRRPSLAVLKATYRFCAVAGRRSFQIWPSVASELRALCGLAPLLFASFHKRFSPWVVAVDASNVAAGVVAAKIRRRAVSAVAASRPARVSDGPKSLHPSLPSSSSSRWRQIVSSRWRFPGHINSLELSALSTSVRWLLSFPRHIRRTVVFLSDSAVVVGAVSKGRSSSFTILRSLRRLNARILASGLRLHLSWVSTLVNPADGASRPVL